MIKDIDHILKRMDAISLAEMLNIRLMDRVDSKFVVPVSILPRLLEKMRPYFKVQENNGTRIAPYCTQYLDTPELCMFFMHQNGKLNRQKIRIRSYTDSQLSFLEVKNKNKKGRTVKIRIPVDLPQIRSVEELDGSKEFLEKNALVDSRDLQPVLVNEFKRITLVNHSATERVTLDFDLLFINNQTGNRKEVNNLLVLELKQDNWQHSYFRDIMNQWHITERSFSKYCMGTILTNPCIQYNRFKRKWTIINQLTQYM